MALSLRPALAGLLLAGVAFAAAPAHADVFSSQGFSGETTTIWPQARHESLNQINRDQIMAGFIAWLERVCPAGSGPSHPA